MIGYFLFSQMRDEVSQTRYDGKVLNLGTSLEFDVKVIYHLRVSRDSSVVFSHLTLWAFFCQSGKAFGVDL